MNSEPISVEMLAALKFQTELFGLIIQETPNKTLKILDKESGVKKNFWQTRRHRSVILTFDVGKPENCWSFPYSWQILFDKPTELIFSKKIEDFGKWEKRDSLDLEYEFYFQLIHSEKRKLISQFVSDCILNSI